jgi:hypothetical protein
VLESFWGLAEADASTREQATSMLLAELASSSERAALQVLPRTMCIG